MTGDETLRKLLADEYGIMSNYELAVALSEMRGASIGLFISRTGKGYMDENEHKKINRLRSGDAGSAGAGDCILDIGKTGEREYALG
jgi:hypothetical protein